MRFLHEPVEVLARVDREGVAVPHAFTWQGRQLTIAELGRRWEEEEPDGPVRHFLVMIANGDRFELIQHVGTGRWHLVRAWEGSSLA